MPLRVDEGTPIPVPAEPPSGGGGGESVDITFGAPPVGNKLKIPIVFQKPMDRLCWAACAKMILRHTGTDASMCEIATVIKGNHCCQDLVECNSDCQPEDVGRVFESFKVEADYVDHAVTFSTVRTHIDDRRMPLEVGIRWPPNNGGHLVVIIGWLVKPQGRFVVVNDPMDGSGDVAFSDLESDYTESHGEWICTWLGFDQ